MPSNVVKSLAKKTDKSEKEVEKLWKEAKKLASEELGKKESDFSDKEWSYVTGILKKMLKIKESTMKDKKLKSFFETKISAKEYMESFAPYIYDEEMDYDDMYEMEDMDYDDYNDDYYDEYGNMVEPDMDETMTSGAFTSPKGPISGTITRRDEY